MIEGNRYVELATWLGTTIKGAALTAAEEILQETTQVLTEAHARLTSDGFDHLASAAEEGLKVAYQALEKVQSL